MTVPSEQIAQPQQPIQSRVALRIALASGPCSIPLASVHHLAGFASLSGVPEEYFLGWLTFHGEQVPVFDLNRVVCDQPTPEHFGSRIIILTSAVDAPTRYIGLLAAGVTDTLSPQQAAEAGIAPLDLAAYLPMLYTMIPPQPVAA